MTSPCIVLGIYPEVRAAAPVSQTAEESACIEYLHPNLPAIDISVDALDSPRDLFPVVAIIDSNEDAFGEEGEDPVVAGGE